MPLQVGVHAGKPAGVPAAVCKRFPHLAGCTPLVIPDNILRQVDLVCLSLTPNFTLTRMTIHPYWSGCPPRRLCLNMADALALLLQTCVRWEHVASRSASHGCSGAPQALGMSAMSC